MTMHLAKIAILGPLSREVFQISLIAFEGKTTMRKITCRIVVFFSVTQLEQVFEYHLEA